MKPVRSRTEMPISVDLTEGVADWWMLGATLGAAVATAASAVVVGVQAVQTGRSTRAAVRAAEAAERNADAAVTAAQVTERMFLRSEQARREAALPKVTMQAAEWSEDAVFRRAWNGTMQWERLPEDFNLVFDGPDSWPGIFDDVALRVPVTVANDGSESAIFTIYNSAFVEEGAPATDQTSWIIRPSGTLIGHVMIARTLGYWGHYDKKHEESDVAGSALITCEVGARRSASQTWEMLAHGHPFRRAPGDEDRLILDQPGTRLYCTTSYLGARLEEAEGGVADVS
jgi:hypothetical protein